MDITIVEGDIVDQDVDAVVNAANSGLMGGGGVDGAILRAGGPAQRRPDGRSWPASARCPPGRRRRPRPARCRPAGSSTSSARCTPARRTAPRCWRRATGRRCAVADELGARSVAFPAVSAGIYGWPIADAADVARAHRRRDADRGHRRPLRAVQRRGADRSSGGPTTSSPA